MSTMDGFIRGEEGDCPVRPRAPVGVEAAQVRLSRLARQARLGGSQEETGPRPPPAPGSSTGPSRPAATGPMPGPGPARHGVRAGAPERPRRSWPPTTWPLCRPKQGRPVTAAPGRGPSRQAGAGPRRNHAADAATHGSVTSPVFRHGKGGSPRPATATGLLLARRSSATPVAGHTPHRADRRGPHPRPPGSTHRSAPPRRPRPGRGPQTGHPDPGVRNPWPATGSSHRSAVPASATTTRRPSPSTGP